MTDFSEQPGNIARIFTEVVNGKKLATCLTLQTERMRDTFSRFSEVLLIDATHGTNESKYKVFSFMAHDVFGKGQFVQHALLENERRETLLTAIEEFKSNNPDWPRIQCILVDKDFTEISVLKQAFPDARILLCQFHVVKYLGEEVANSAYGFSVWQKEQLRDVVRLLVYAKTEVEYEKHRRYLKHLAELGMGFNNTSRPLQDGRTPDRDDDVESRPLHPFEDYFRRNWDSCRDLWCSYTRQNAITLGNNTNNRLEASWKQIKDVVNSSMGLDECAAAVMLYQARAELYVDSLVHKVSVVHHAEYDAEMTVVANLVSQHACELIYEQYEYAVNRASYTYSAASAGVISIKNNKVDDDAFDEPSIEYCIRESNWQCSCLFMTTRLLPCRHVFYVRKNENFETVIPVKLLHPRWLLSTLKCPTLNISPPTTPFRVGSVIPRSTKAPWDTNRKFREAQCVSNAIASNISDLGMREFAVAMNVLHTVSEIFAAKQFDRIAPARNSYVDTILMSELSWTTTTAEFMFFWDSNTSSGLPPLAKWTRRSSSVYDTGT